MMDALLTRTDGTRVHTTLAITPMRYSHAAQGGPDTAELAVAGDAAALTDVLSWLACTVRIVNDSGTAVWWGLVQAVSVSIGGVEYSRDAAEIVNRMAVLYTDLAGNAAQTLWVEDAHSIAQYGRREVRESVRAESTTVATAQATLRVNERSAPLRSVRAAAGAGDGAKLYCVGLWRTLDWRYWSQDGGQELRDEDANTTELTAWAVSGADIGFNRPLLRVAKLTADLHPLMQGDRIQASGSGSNDALYEVAEPDDRTDETTYTSVEFSFDTTDDVHDEDGLLNMFRPGDLISIDGSTANDGEYFIKDYFQNGDGGYDHMRVYPGTIADELAGATITIEAGNSIAVVERPAAYELPSATITLASHAVKVAQAVTIGASAAWELSEVRIQAAQVGSPSDSLKIEVCSDSSGAPGTVLKSATVVGSTLPLVENIDWVEWPFDHAQMLAPATTYWIVVSRTGSAAVDAYRLGLLETEAALSADNLLLWDGAAWVARTVASGLDAHLSVRVFGLRLTTDQITNIVDGVGDWLSGVSIRTASGLRTGMYRSEEDAQTALSEVKALLEFGTSSGARLLARVNADGMLIVDAAPASTTPRYLWTADGLRDRTGLPLGQGELPVGEWVGFDVVGAADAFAPAFLEAAEFDVASGAVRPSFRAEQPIQALARLGRPANVPDLAVRLAPYLTGPGRRSGGSTGGGTADHGALTGLADDDHLQYHTDARGDARYSVLSHTHSGAGSGDMTKAVYDTDDDGVVDEAVEADTVDGQHASEFAAAGHTHALDDLTDVSAATPSDGDMLVWDDADDLWKPAAPAAAGAVATDAIWDAKGDLAVGTGANTGDRLPIGTDGKILVADSGEAKGMRWGTIPIVLSGSNYESTTQSTSAYSWKGNLYTPGRNMQVYALQYRGDVVASGVYKAIVGTLSGTTIASILGESATFTVSASVSDTDDHRIWLFFATPVALTADTKYFFMVGRTDGAADYALPVPFNTDAPAPFDSNDGFAEGIRLAKVTPEVGDTISTTADNVSMGWLWSYPDAPGIVVS